MVVVIDMQYPSLSRHHVLCLHPELACLGLDFRSLRYIYQTCLFCINRRKNKKACFSMFSTPFPGLENESGEALCSCQQCTMFLMKMERLSDVH